MSAGDLISRRMDACPTCIRTLRWQDACRTCKQGLNIEGALLQIPFNWVGLGPARYAWHMEVGDFIRLCAECCPLCQNRGEAAPCANCYHAGTLAWCAQLREVAFACAGCMFQATTRREVGLHCAGCRFYHAATMGHVDGADAWLRTKVPRIQRMPSENSE